VNNDSRVGEADFLELFYPIHYKIGMALEDALRAGDLTRKQVAILWLIRSEGEEGRSIRRKDIQRVLGTWFEVSNPTITKALRAMERPPRSLLKVLEYPRSGREKLVVLTPKGERFLMRMVEEGKSFLRPIVAELSPASAQQGLRFLKSITAIHESVTCPKAPGGAAINGNKSAGRRALERLPRRSVDRLRDKKIRVKRRGS